MDSIVGPLGLWSFPILNMLISLRNQRSSGTSLPLLGGVQNIISPPRMKPGGDIADRPTTDEFGRPIYAMQTMQPSLVTNREDIVWTDWKGRERKMSIHREVK